ncbi:imelysin family protein [Flavicella sp.]|uniref:imelysin family protein n=1 Tax=Flavicella sp. TaxID=2957742 RepID=UPI0030195162
MKKIFYCLLMVLALGSCKGGSSVADCMPDSFDRSALLTNWADNIIIPSYTLYVDELTSLQTAKDVFIETPNEQNLVLLRTEWLEAYIVWQNVSIYEIGKAENIRLRDYTNTFNVPHVKDEPETDKLTGEFVEENISSGSYDLTLSTQLRSQGFPALDYLLNGLGDTDAEILLKYTSDENAAKYTLYLDDVSNRLLSMGAEVMTDWNNGYRNTFITNDCNASTSSLNKLTNDLIFNLEKATRSAQIGTPIGYLGEPVVIPEKVQAFYKQDVSKVLLIASLTASKNLFNGKHLNSDTVGESLKSYLDELQITAVGNDLSIVLDTYYEEAISEAQKLDENFYEGISQVDIEKYRDIRESIHLIIEVLKTNMISALDIKADYSDSDGD